ncbi:MAG: TonB-dependent receptor [Woeseiaceae bacterium]|nr:TonB-dependent receptor [Woeseiaceae bacterium]
MKIKGITVALIVLSTPSNDVKAQQEEPIDEIQVTASRRPVSATKVSAALTVVSGEKISGQKLATDALANEIGVFLQQTTVGQGAAIIRGLKGSEILHLVDGLRLNNAMFRNAPTQYLSLVAPGSIERMEVVRGSPTSLYGSDAVGGVIQVISRLPSFDSDDFGVSREVHIAADSAELGKSLRASLDMGNRTAAGLLSVAWQDSGDRRTGDGTRIKPSGFSSHSARAALVLHPADDRSWVFDAQFTRQPETPRVDELVPGYGETDPASSEFFFEPNERQFVHIRHTRDDALWGADWTLDLGWQRIVDDRRSRNFGSDQRRFEKNRSDLLGLSINAARMIGNASWVFGGELYHDKVSSSRIQRDVNNGLVEEQQARFPDGSTVQQAALFAHLSQPIAERHTLSGGVRLNAVDIEVAATSDYPAANIDIHDFSADIGWLYDLNDTTQLVTNLGHGFRAPNIFDLGTLGERPGNRFNIPNTSLKSERVTQLDLALRKRMDAWSAEFVVFRLDYTDKIQSALTGDITSDGRDVVQSRNFGRAENYGFEAGMRWHPAGQWSAELLINYTRGKQREDDGSLTAGDRIPPLNGRVSLDWSMSAAWSLSTSLIFADEQSRLSPRDVRDVRINPNGTPGWATASVSVNWQPSSIWSINGGVENALDQRYRVHGSGIDAPGINVFIAARANW